jgi:hypothetical protein
MTEERKTDGLKGACGPSESETHGLGETKVYATGFSAYLPAEATDKLVQAWRTTYPCTVVTVKDDYVDNLDDKKMVPDLSTMQPKETAPRDGRWFIAYCPDSPTAWTPFEVVAWTDYTYNGERKRYFCGQDVSEEVDFEGWWPLPVLRLEKDPI